VIDDGTYHDAVMVRAGEYFQICSILDITGQDSKGDIENPDDRAVGKTGDAKSHSLRDVLATLL